FIPRSRNGLSFNDMNEAQRELASGVMSTFLSARGYEKITQIRSLESVLKEIEVNGRFVRDPNAYFITVFGEPSLNGTWALRFEGHHIALNWTFVEGSGIASTPQFFGSNPAKVRSGPQAGLRVLDTEEDLGRQLITSMDVSQRSQAVLEIDVPRDIFTAAEDEVSPFETTGILFGALNSAQQLNLMNLIEEVASAQPDAVSAARMTQVRNGRDAIRFTWIGETGESDAHYWRVQGNDFLIEYDKTQNNANHIHLVWRDFDGDFGRDLIRLHYDAVAAQFGPGHRH
ncbi:MAG: DUF3500 domain-containing protein, partial [Gammaproteobacteria bacterium]|nr:DUF3500 domain-containing protein [Gammaproteobacteria bacterium]